MQTKIKREKLIKIGGFFTGFTKRGGKKTAEEMNNRQGKRKEKEVGECCRREAVSASDRRLSSGFTRGGFFFLSAGCIAAGKAWAAAVVASRQDAADRQAKTQLSSPAD